MTAVTKIDGIAADLDGFDIDAATDTLSVIANWKADLLDRIRRTVLIFQLHDCETEIGPLVEEVAAFRRVCSCLAWRQEQA